MKEIAAYASWVRSAPWPTRLVWIAHAVLKQSTVPNLATTFRLALHVPSGLTSTGPGKFARSQAPPLGIAGLQVTRYSWIPGLKPAPSTLTVSPLGFRPSVLFTVMDTAANAGAANQVPAEIARTIAMRSRAARPRPVAPVMWSLFRSLR